MSYMGFLKRRLARFAAHESGVAAIELAAVAGPLIIGLVIGADMALSIQQRNKVNAAAQAGAQYAALNGFDSAKIKAAVTNATTISGLTISEPVKFCGCAGQTSVDTASCGTSCAGGSVAANYSRVTVSKTYSPLFAVNRTSDGKVLTSTTTVRLP